MATKFLVVDDGTGKKSLSSLFVIEDFDVAIAGTTFTVANDFDNISFIEVFRNGQLLREGGSYDYTRNEVLNQIIFNSPVAQGSWVRIKVWLQ